MTIVLTIASLPFLIWLWLGITFTIARYVFIVAYMEGLNMTEEPQTIEAPARAKLIRYETVTDTTRPGLLSYYDAERNIQHIDRQRADLLPEKMRERLEVSELAFTKLTEDGLRFVEYPA
jgi:hypothetical protein